VKALEVGKAVGRRGDTSEYDVFLCMGIAVRGLGGVAGWDVFAWAYAVVICSGMEFLRVHEVKAVGEGEAKDSGCDKVVFTVNHCSNGRRGFVLVRGCASGIRGFVRWGVFH
jgi:hypothetical protein